MLQLFRLLAYLPLSWLQAIGRLLGRFTRARSQDYRERLHDNAVQAGYDDPALEREAAAQAGASVLELPHVWFRGDRAVDAVVCDDWAVVEAARAEARGILFLTPHWGCFEVTARYYARVAPITVLYRPPRKRWLAPLIEGARSGANLNTAPATLKGVRELVRALRRGEAVGMLPDQVPGEGEGVWAPFFGRSAFTMTLPGKLAAQTGAAVILAGAERLPGGKGWRLHLSRVDGPVPEDAVEQATWVNAAMERMVRRNPGQYLWGYNRYKTPRGTHAAAPEQG